MKVLVEGVWVKLTDEQIKYVEDQITTRERKAAVVTQSFKHVLSHFGFKRQKDAPGFYYQKEYDWLVEVVDPSQSINWEYAWGIGAGLKCGGFPGGWRYDDPQELFKALSDAVTNSLK